MASLWKGRTGDDLILFNIYTYIYVYFWAKLWITSKPYSTLSIYQPLLGLLHLFVARLLYYKIRNFVFGKISICSLIFFSRICYYHYHDHHCCHHHHPCYYYTSGYVLLVPFLFLIQGKWGRSHPKKLRISYIVPTIYRRIAIL